MSKMSSTVNELQFATYEVLVLLVIYKSCIQVSHHPPVSAFYAECEQRGISMTSHIWTRSKFMNMSIGVNNIGEGQ